LLARRDFDELIPRAETLIGRLTVVQSEQNN